MVKSYTLDNGLGKLYFLHNTRYYDIQIQKYLPQNTFCVMSVLSFDIT